MTVELEQQLRDYVSHVAELSTPVELEKVAHEANKQAIVLPDRPPPQARWAGALAAAVILLVLIGGLALGYRLLISEDPPVITEPSPTSTIPVPTTTLPSPTTAPSSTTTVAEPGAVPLIDWVEATPQETLGAGDADHEYLVHTIVEGGPGLIAAGRITAAPGGLFYQIPIGDRPEVGDEAALWTTEDGVTWDRVETSGLSGSGGYAIRDLVVGGPGYVAVGMASEEGIFRSQSAVWVSEDALAWTRVESPTFEGEWMESVAASDAGVVAVGDGGIWFSPDGLSWQRAATTTTRYYLDVTRADWGFVAVGQLQDMSTDYGDTLGTWRPLVAISPDGLDWEQVDLSEMTEEPERAWALSVAAAGTKVVVAGADLAGKWNPVFWTSGDGLSWDRYAIPEAQITGAPHPESSIVDLAITDGGTVAVGRYWPASSGVRAAVWATSASEGTWHEDALGRSFAVERVDDESPATTGFGAIGLLDGKLVGISTDAGRTTVWIGEWAQ